ncbi:MAG: hypothetical protein MSC45_09980 [Mobiluncus sp.]|uniref:Uncharacterized protein n=1 Tax=Mobiluncus porci TaxID=2652278 RepID=A0A7K0K000_9ACTO|nr:MULTISPECIES: hypothetical protein [Mobiluncus]MCI6585370.1 hypothetical protein [Mobiluncus sp.]MST48837.1 hypothetical protein [Mobiluncus porci]
MTWLGIVWLCLAIFAVAMLVLTLIWLFFKGRALYRAVSAIEFPESSETISEPRPPRAPGPTGDPSTLTSARVAHQDVKLQRRLNREKRLERAQGRWADYGLVELPR